MTGNILVTGFGPFGRYSVNSSWEAIRSLNGEVLGGYRIVARQLPVSFDRSGRVLVRLLKQTKPAVLVAFGLVPAGGVRIEATARNVDRSAKPDVDGYSPRGRPIVRGGPARLQARFPVRDAARALRRAGIRAEISTDAGTYICNHILYFALRRTRCPVVFVHVPPLGPRRHLKEYMTRRQLARVAQTVLKVAVKGLCARRLNAQR